MFFVMTVPLAKITPFPIFILGSIDTSIPARDLFPILTNPDVLNEGPQQKASPILLWCSIELFELIKLHFPIFVSAPMWTFANKIVPSPISAFSPTTAVSWIRLKSWNWSFSNSINLDLKSGKLLTVIATLVILFDRPTFLTSSTVAFPSLLIPIKSSI